MCDRRCDGFLVMLALVLFAGCSANPTSGIGVVRFSDGEPVRSGSIEFRPLAGGDRYASRIDQEGGFDLIDKDDRPGIPDGDYEVVVVQIVLTEDLATADHTHGTTVPRRYADYYTSDLRVTTRTPSSGPITVELATQ